MRVLRAKYVKEKNLSLRCNLNETLLLYGRAFARFGFISKKGMIGNGKRVRFWLDAWLYDEGPLINKARAEVPIDLQGKCVADFIDIDGDWRWNAFKNLLPTPICLKIAGLRPPNMFDYPDRITWGPTNDGKFSVKSAYTGSSWSSKNKKWKDIWSW